MKVFFDARKWRQIRTTTRECSAMSKAPDGRLLALAVAVFLAGCSTKGFSLKQEDNVDTLNDNFDGTFRYTHVGYQQYDDFSNLDRLLDKFNMCPKYVIESRKVKTGYNMTGARITKYIYKGRCL
jgi:hypothetical protein